ncbi:MAG: MFS transporter [Cytophagaceae bacterium]|nr:MFS transporter [Cytophagaceae bacterium]
MTSSHQFKFKEVFNITVIVAALGYFVDVYDLVLFLIVGKTSIRELIPGIPKSEEIANFKYLLNVQMMGMLVGGIFWGVMGDKKGRLSVLFGSIIMYSLANIANGLIAHIDAAPDNLITIYAIMRFIAGVGLAGELGAGVTLVMEIMGKETRGYGAMMVASIGVIGAVVAALIGMSDLGWEVTYYIGGGLGLLLLILRLGVFESGMFEKMKNEGVRKGDFFLLFKTKERMIRYIKCLLIGLPVWFIIGILVGLAPEIANILNVTGTVQQELCVMICYIGLVFGDIASGALSQVLKSRKKVFFIFYSLCCIFIAIYLNLNGVSYKVFYTLIFLLGFSVGFWAILIMVGSESFGTNVRATATTTVPNFVRGSLVLITLLFDLIYGFFPKGDSFSGLIPSAAIVTCIVMIISFGALYFLEETFGKDLNYLEQDPHYHEKNRS